MSGLPHVSAGATLRPRTLARDALLAHAASGGEEYVFTAETLRTAIDQAEIAGLSMYAADAYVAEIARGLVEGLDELDRRTEAALKAALGYANGQGDGPEVTL